MRVGIAILFATALLAGCERTETSPATPLDAETAAAVAAARPRPIAPVPETPLRPMEILPAETEQASAQAEESRRELDRRAAALEGDITTARQQADAAVRAAARPELTPGEQSPQQASTVPPPPAAETPRRPAG